MQLLYVSSCELLGLSIKFSSFSSAEGIDIAADCASILSKTASEAVGNINLSCCLCVCFSTIANDSTEHVGDWIGPFPSFSPLADITRVETKGELNLSG